MASASCHRCFSTPLCPLRFTPPPLRPPPSKLLFPSPAILSHRRSPNYAFRIQNKLSPKPPSALPFDLSPPPIDHDLHDTVAAVGAKLSEDGIIETFDNDYEALNEVDNGVVVADLSHFGRIRVSGEDRIQFLHNQSTANFECLHEGQGCDTYSSHNRYCPCMDYEECSDIGSLTNDQWKHNSNAEEIMMELNLGDLVGQPHGTHKHYTVNRMPVTVAVGNIITEEGFSLLMSPAAAGSVWKTLLSKGAIPMGSKAWETFRVFQGRPAPGKELTDEYNVLEAGLWNSISLNKGCYKGQETISRLITYDGVKQRLWGIRLSSPVEPDSPITLDAKKVGKLTSYASGANKSEHFGLGYIKRKAASKGDTVIVGDNVVGTVVEVPFLARQRPPPSKSSNS